MTGASFVQASAAASGFRAGKASPVEMVKALLDRIQKLEPSVRAWETVDADRAIASARVAEKEIRAGRVRSPLHGVTIGLKDIYYTAGLRTTMSSKIFRDFVPTFDCAFVERLKAAGVIAMGKTVTTEFATGDPSPTRNPWDPARTPGGSSSGSAVAVAVGMVPLASGSQTAGSVVRPAAFNGVVGFKPTYGLASRFGVFPCSWTLDTLGWMSRSVTDAALLLDVVAGFDARDPGSVRATAPEAGASVEPPKGWAPRIGLVVSYFGQKASLESSSQTLESVERLKLAGAIVEPFELPQSFDGIHAAQLVIDYTECSMVHREMFSERPGDYAPNIRSRIECGALIPAWSYVQGQRLRRQFRREMDEALEGFDAIVMPSTPGPAPDTSTTGDPMFQTPWTVAGLPEITIPTRLSKEGLPLGIQFVGRGFEDARVLRTARWAERELSVDLGVPPLAR
ncbi:MAG: amidase [Chloroflexi bacterium]|nr:amidase [Chloroflexota bacterium]